MVQRERGEAGSEDGLAAAAAAALCLCGGIAWRLERVDLRIGAEELGHVDCKKELSKRRCRKSHQVDGAGLAVLMALAFRPLKESASRDQQSYRAVSALAEASCRVSLGFVAVSFSSIVGLKISRTSRGSYREIRTFSFAALRKRMGEHRVMVVGLISNHEQPLTTLTLKGCEMVTSNRPKAEDGPSL